MGYIGVSLHISILRGGGNLRRRILLRCGLFSNMWDMRRMDAARERRAVACQPRRTARKGSSSAPGPLLYSESEDESG